MKEVTKNNFDEEVLNSQTTVLVDFWAPWCGPCQMLGKVLEEVDKEYSDRLKVVKINVDENTDLAEQYEVMSIPTLKIFKNGSEVDSLIGAQPKQSIIKQLDTHL